MRSNHFSLLLFLAVVMSWAEAHKNQGSPFFIFIYSELCPNWWKTYMERLSPHLRKIDKLCRTHNYS